MASGSSTSLRLAIILGSGLALAGCDTANMPGFLAGGGGKSTAPNTSSRTVERDIEAPEVFQVTDKGLWDGRPSLGGVWVAHPEVKDPERVIIRNTSNGQFVIGVVYRPERSTPGPKIQVSSDAAEALGMLAGAPAELSVTALRHEEVPVGGPARDAAPDADAPATALAAAPAVETNTLDPIAAAARALDEAESGPALSADALAAPQTAAAPAATPAAPPVPKSSLEKPYLQIGIFSVESNANATADALRRAGMVPTVKPGKTSGKAFWRVVVGPATTAGDRAALLKKIKALGFTDAYAVTN